MNSMICYSFSDLSCRLGELQSPKPHFQTEPAECEQIQLPQLEIPPFDFLHPIQCFDQVHLTLFCSLLRLYFSVLQQLSLLTDK